MSSGIMDTMMQSQMEQPMPVCCTDCQWKGYDNELIFDKELKVSACPDCNSYAIEYDIPDYYTDNLE